HRRSGRADAPPRRHRRSAVPARPVARARCTGRAGVDAAENRDRPGTARAPARARVCTVMHPRPRPAARVAQPDDARLLTAPFLLSAAANLLQSLAFNLYLHLPGYLKELG